MPDYTSNYKFRQPTFHDPVNVETDVNANMDKFDKYVNAVIGVADLANAPNGQLYVEDSGTRLFGIKIASALIPVAPLVRPKGRIGSSQLTSPSSVATATEILTGLAVTFTAEVGRRYVFNYQGSVQWQTDPGGGAPFNASSVLRVRWATGASITTSSTLLATQNANVSGILGKERTFNKFVEFFPNLAGQVTIGLTIQGFTTRGMRINANGTSKIAMAYVRDYGA